jgi:D-alanyl-lipoteichoic acid acyltransferase DltB (MBOAT superfamily)
MTRSAGFLEMWQNLLLLYLRGACFAMGIWSLAEAAAAFLGVRLRPNFRGVLLARNPSQFWRAWRGTMANWLIQHVYIPLGGGRHRRTRNIAAVFAFSTVWHCIGIPFLRPASFGFDHVTPILTWGALNFAGVAGHAWFRRAFPAEPQNPLLRGASIGLSWALTLCFGSLTVALLGFATAYVERFAHVMRTLCGLAGW